MRSEIIAYQRRIWGHKLQECATRGCQADSMPESCYCRACEREILLEQGEYELAAAMDSKLEEF